MPSFAPEDVCPPAKRRKPRPHYSCQDCRRLKMKCDREVPCSNCVRRHREEQCVSDSTRTSSHSSVRATSATQRLTETAREHPDDLERLSTPSSLDPSLSLGNRDSHGMQSQQHAPTRRSPITNVNSGMPQHSGDYPGEPSPSLNPHKQAALSNSVTCPDIVLHRDFDLSMNPDFSPAVVVPVASISNRDSTPSSAHIPPVYQSPTLILESTGCRGPNHVVAGQSVDVENDSLIDRGHGTLVISHSGSSKYLGPTAASEWLKDSERQDVNDTPVISRAVSPELPLTGYSLPVEGHQPVLPIAFPFNSSSSHISTAALLSRLPNWEEAMVLVDAYYRYCAWHHDVVPRTSFQPMFERIFAAKAELDPSRRINPQELALIYIVLAQGTLFNIEMPNIDPSAEEWLHLSERALVKGDFLANNTIPAVQTLHLMAHYHLHVDKGRRGDYAWPLWGLTMRLIQAMGMHRDGAKWSLREEVVEERRKVFWECNAADTFQAHCFSRPCAINPEHCDTSFPTLPRSPAGEKCYSILRYELSQLSGEILNMAMKVKRQPYSSVLELHDRVCAFEENLPFSLRCRAALLAMPSRFPEPAAAIEMSSEPSRRSMASSFQQTSLALNISETIIFLHRPYFAKALYCDGEHGMRSTYAPSYLAVVERCGLIISIVADIHRRFPIVSTRQWHLWYHVFNSAVCIGALVLHDPGNALAGFALNQIEAAITLHTGLIQSGASTQRSRNNLEWLLKLRARAVAKVSSSQAQQRQQQQHNRDPADTQAVDGVNDSEEDVELLGWRTRLIERASQNQHTARTIPSPSSTASASIAMDDVSRFDFLRSAINHQVGQPDGAVPHSEDIGSADYLLYDFWDPIIFQDVLNTSSE